MGRGAATHCYSHSMAEYHSLRTAVLAARDELERAGVHPSVDRIAKAARIRHVDVDCVSDILCDGAYVEHPDDPDAAEIQARIAEVRAEKEAASPLQSTMKVARGRFHHPSRHKGSHQHIVA